MCEFYLYDTWHDLQRHSFRYLTHRQHSVHTPRTEELAYSAPSDPLPLSQKIIVFFHHKNVLSAIEDALLQLRVSFIKIDGATSQKNRGKLIERFQNDDVVSSCVQYCKAFTTVHFLIS